MPIFTERLTVSVKIYMNPLVIVPSVFSTSAMANSLCFQLKMSETFGKIVEIETKKTY